jgi:zinc/manganese transport system substrate-binding protein
MLLVRNVITNMMALACVAALSSAAMAEPRIKAVATFSILGDLVRQVGGDDVDVSVLVGPDGDAHVFQPSPADARTIADANIVFVNGLGLEGWMARLVKASGAKAPTVTVSTGIRTLRGEEPGGKGARAHGHDHGTLDPHAWQDVANAKIYANNIRDALVKADPEGRARYEQNASTYLQKLDALDVEVREMLARIPPANRRVITTHDAFGYYSRAYGITFVAPQGISTEAEASSRDVARIIRQIKAEKVPAVFLENISDSRLISQIARETQTKIGEKVYSDSLSKADGPAATYIDMIRHNTRAFASALGG